MVVDSLGLVGVPAIDVDGDELGRVATGLLLDLVDGRGGADAERAQRRLPVPVRWPAGA